MSKRAFWPALQDHHMPMQGLNLKKLFANDLARGERMTAEAAGIALMNTTYSPRASSGTSTVTRVALADQFFRNLCQTLRLEAKFPLQFLKRSRSALHADDAGA